MTRATNGPAIKALRELLGHSQEELARNAGISGPYLANIEAGRKQPAPVVMRRLADALGVPLAAITYPANVTWVRSEVSEDDQLSAAA